MIRHLPTLRCALGPEAARYSFPRYHLPVSVHPASVSAGGVNTQPGRFGGLDGLRALAVSLVLIYHLFPNALPGGFLGVDVFFVISGFLITSLLLREWEATGRIDLLGFWRRRARRLLPAVALVVLVSTSLALSAGRDLLVGLANQIAGAVFFVSNWVFIADGSDYFARDSPELFRNFWSLALEEQFYIVLPVIAIVSFGMRSRLTRTVPLVALGVASALLMAGLSASGADPTRIYFGSDSHSFGLLLGAALATALPRPSGAPMSRRSQAVSLTTASVSLAVLLILAFTLREGSVQSFSGGFQLAAVAALALVWAVTRQGAIAGRLLDVQPLRWIGERSYGIYLWHWPLLVITTSISIRAGYGTTIAAPVATFILTLGLSALSYRYVEQPVRRVGLRSALIGWFSPRSYTPRRRAVSIALAVVVAVTFPLTGFAVAIAPDQTSSEATIMRGKELLDAERAAASDRAAKDHAEAESTDASRGGNEGEAADSGDPDPGEDVSAQPVTVVRIDGGDITAVGDSVMLASYPELSSHFPGIGVDAAVSRGLWAGVDIVSEMRAAGALRQVVVVGLGTNGPVDAEALVELKKSVGSRLLVLVNAHGERDWIPGANAELEAFAAANRSVTLARWDESISPFPELLAEDGIHPDSDGGEIYSRIIREALDELQAPGEAAGWSAPRR